MMYDLLAKICNRQGTPLDLQRLEELAVFVKETSLCGLGMSAPNPLLSTLRYFRNEYLDGQDKMMQILNRLDQERVFTNLAIQRLTEGLEKTKIKVREHEQEITAIKHQLHLH